MNSPRKIFFVLLFTFSLVKSLVQNEDLINLTNYKYPLPTDKRPYVYIPILSTNDLHGEIFPEKYSDPNKIRYSNGGGNYLYSYKKILKEEWGDRLLWLDAGDQFQGTMECMLSDCYIMKDYYNKAGLDAITLGNHDFDYEIPHLKKFIKEMKFPLICSNIKEKDSGKYIYETWENVKAYKIYEFKIDESDPTKIVKIGIIGLATETSPTQTSANLTNLIFTNYIEETEKWNKKLREEEKVNVVVVITHFGPYCGNDGNEKYVLKIRDSKTTQKTCDPEEEENIYLEELKKRNITIDAVIAGHVHNVVHHWIANVPVVQSSGSDYFNILYLAFAKDSKTSEYIFKKEGVKIEGPVPVCEKLWPDYLNCIYRYKDSSLMKNFVFHNKKIEIDTEMKDLLKDWEKIINEKIENNLAETESDMTKKYNEESFLPNFINDVGKIITNSDICFFNNGGIRSSWRRGLINEIDLFKMFPFNNTWIRFEMTGEEVMHMIQDIDTENIYPSSGLIQTFLYRKERYTVKNLLVYDGFEERPLNPKKTYKICTNDYLAEGGSEMNKVKKWYKELRNKKDFGIIRELIKDFFSKMKGKIREDKFSDKKYPRITIEK